MSDSTNATPIVSGSEDPETSIGPLKPWRAFWNPQRLGLWSNNDHASICDQPLKASDNPGKQAAVNAQMAARPCSSVLEPLDTIIAQLDSCPSTGVIDDETRAKLEGTREFLRMWGKERMEFVGNPYRWFWCVESLSAGVFASVPLLSDQWASPLSEDDRLEEYEILGTTRTALQQTLTSALSAFAGDLQVAWDMTGEEPSARAGLEAVLCYASGPSPFKGTPSALSSLASVAESNNWSEWQRLQQARKDLTALSHPFHRYATEECLRGCMDLKSVCMLDILEQGGTFTGFHPRNPLYTRQQESEANCRQQVDAWSHTWNTSDANNELPPHPQSLLITFDKSIHDMMLTSIAQRDWQPHGTYDRRSDGVSMLTSTETAQRILGQIESCTDMSAELRALVSEQKSAMLDAAKRSHCATTAIRSRRTLKSDVSQSDIEKGFDLLAHEAELKESDLKTWAAESRKWQRANWV